MPKIDKALRRDKKKHKERYGMQMSGRTTKTTLLQVIERKTKELIHGSR